MNVEMGIELITILMFGSMLVLMMLGLPVAFSCGRWVSFSLQFCKDLLP